MFWRQRREASGVVPSSSFGLAEAHQSHQRHQGHQRVSSTSVISEAHQWHQCHQRVSSASVIIVVRVSMKESSSENSRRLSTNVPGDAEVDTSADLEVALTTARRIPVEMHLKLNVTVSSTKEGYGCGGMRGGGGRKQ